MLCSLAPGSQSMRSDNNRRDTSGISGKNHGSKRIPGGGSIEFFENLSVLIVAGMGPVLRPHVALEAVHAMGTEYRTRATRKRSTVTTSAIRRSIRPMFQHFLTFHGRAGRNPLNSLRFAVSARRFRVEGVMKFRGKSVYLSLWPPQKIGFVSSFRC